METMHLFHKGKILQNSIIDNLRTLDTAAKAPLEFSLNRQVKSNFSNWAELSDDLPRVGKVKLDYVLLRNFLDEHYRFYDVTIHWIGWTQGKFDSKYISFELYTDALIRVQSSEFIL